MASLREVRALADAEMLTGATLAVAVVASFFLLFI